MSRADADVGRAPRRYCARAGMLALVVLGSSQFAMAQEGPVIFGQQQRPPAFSIEPPRTALEFTYRREDDSNESRSGGGTLHTVQQSFRETLSLDTTGYIVHPNLVDFSLGGSFGLQQQSFDQNGTGYSDNGYIYAYDATATFLRKETAPLTIYARRTEDLLLREFGSALDSTITTYGATWDVRSETLPTRLEAYRTEERQTSLDNTDNFAIDRNTLQWHSSAKPVANNTISWDYSFNDVDESSDTSRDHYESHDATLADSLTWGANDRFNLGSTVNYYNQGGTIGLERLRWTEMLRVRHSPTFDTRYDYSLTRQSYANIDQLQQRGTASFRHRLYESLVTTGNAGVQFLTQTPEAKTDEYFANLNFDYHKRVPFGSLGAGLGLGWDLENNSTRTSPTPVIDQPATFTDPNPIVLVGRNILPGSIVVTDPAGFVTYVRNMDYTVMPHADRVELDRVIGGAIPSGTPVLLDYVLGPQPSNTILSNNLTLNGRYDLLTGPLRGLAVYGRYMLEDQNIDTPDPTAVINGSYQDYLAGAEYRIGDITLSAEEQLHDAEFMPYDAQRYGVRAQHRLSLDTTLTLSSGYTTINYMDSGDQTDLITVSGLVGYDIDNRLNVSLGAQYRNQQDTRFGASDGVEGQLQLRWRYRQTEVRAIVRDTLYQTAADRNQYQFFQVVLRREF